MNFISDDEFARLVSEDVKNKVSSRQRQILLDFDNWGRWQQTLLMLIDNLQEQSDDIDADREADRIRFESMGEDGLILLQESELAYTSRKTKIERFKFHVNRRLDDVTTIIETGTPEGVQDDSMVSSGDANFYRKAIIEHRALIKEYRLEETEIDKALWRALDNEWTFGDITEDNF